MFLLLFLIFLIQFFTHWIFEPLAYFLEDILEIRFFSFISLLVFILLFSAKNIDKNK